MKKRFLSVIVTLSFIITSLALPAFAATPFPDVLSPDHDWAAEQIAEMTGLGIIKGYTDGTFKPDKAISKIEALLLFSRVAGYSDENYAPCVEFAQEKYQYLLAELDLGAYDSLKNELAFLLYKEIMTDDELEAYVEDEAYLDEFPRADAAMLLANLMEAEVKRASGSSLDFADADEIPDEAAGYIAYVVENGYMNGVQKDDGTIVFDAEGALSRAQVCVLLYRILDKLEMSVENGVVTDVDIDGGTVDFESADGEENSYIVPEDAKIIIDGAASTLDKLLNNSEIVVVRHGKNIYSIEAINPESNSTIEGTVEAFVSRKDFIKLSVTIEGTEDIATYYANEEFKVTTDGVVDEIDAIELGDYVVVKLLGTDIVSVDRQTAQATVQGVVESISFTSPITIEVLTVDEISKKENLSEYAVSEKATIRRNGERATLREVLVGDEVVLTVERGSVSKIVATSKAGKVIGTVTGINISAQSSVVLSVNGDETEYPITIDATFTVGGASGSIYDLRLGNIVELELSGNTAVKVTQASSSSVTTKSGIVENISTSYGYITILSSGATGALSEQIFLSKTGASITAKILNGETGKDIALKNINKGDNVIVTGSYSNGAFVAKTVIVTPSAE